MSRKSDRFNGVIVYPGKVTPMQPTTVGAWLGHDLTLGQLKQLMYIARQCIGEMEVHSHRGAATIRYVIPEIPRRRDIRREAANFLSRLVKHVTGDVAIIEELRSNREVDLALSA